MATRAGGRKTNPGWDQGWGSSPNPCWERSEQAPSWQCGVLFVPSPGAEGTHVVEQGFLGVLPKFLVQCLLENAHPGRHQQGKGEGSNACKGSTALQLQLATFGFQGKKKNQTTKCPDSIRKLITILGFDYRLRSKRSLKNTRDAVCATSDNNQSQISQRAANRPRLEVEKRILKPPL